MVEIIVVLVFTSFGVVPIVLVAWLVMSASRSAMALGTCRRCGYDLRKLGDRRRCPECGEPFRLGSRGEPIS